MSDKKPTPFFFDSDRMTVQSGSPAPASANPRVEMERLLFAVEASGIAAYRWVVASDEITWSANSADVLGCDPGQVATGRSFAANLDPENISSRYDTVMRGTAADDGQGVPFQIEYRFCPEGRKSRLTCWIEEKGRWFAGPDGRPAEVFGSICRVEERQQRDQQLNFLGNCDPLTGMMNRGRLSEALGEAMSVATRDGASCAFIIAAINNLAVVNDAYGFEVAEEVIVSMGKRLRQVVRTGDAIARYSGSKFGIILNNCSDEELTIAAERFLDIARESVIETGRGPVWAMLSIGAVTLPRNAPDAGTAMARAEEALTEARKQPSDGFYVYKPSVERASLRSLNAKNAGEIVRCLRDNCFRLAFQPVIDAATGEPAFHEALLRMVDKSGEAIAAAHLIPLAEKLGLVRLIDRAIVQLAIATLVKFQDACISINVSGTTATDPRWYPQIVEMLVSNRQVTDRLIFEITETVALGDMRETIRFVERLRELGCRVAIDDFGAGYTSFRNLRGLPVDILKLDGTFCAGLSNSPDNQYFVRSLIDLAKTFKMKTVAEWVETEADAKLLREWQVDFMQGNHFGEAKLDLPWEATGSGSFETAEEIPFLLPSDFSAGEAETAEAPQPRPASDAAEPEIDVPSNPAADGRPAAGDSGDMDSTLTAQMEKLRQTIAALDASFNRKVKAPAAEPSYADLVSESARRSAG